METSLLPGLVERYRADPESVYNTWFVSGEERMKAFRSIRRGVRDTVDSIAAGTFGNDFKGSPLEFVLTAITEQKEVFAGAAHPFYWKPKLRIPDIYEDKVNKRRFGACLEACLNAKTEAQVLAELSRISQPAIKGLGPAVASIVYFLHPTIVPPFNTAIVKGFNALFGEKMKLGSWDSYIRMREVIVQANEQVRERLSKDLGAFAGLLFEIGCGRLVVPGNAEAIIDAEAALKAAELRHRKVLEEERAQSSHTEMQHMLITIGRALDCDVFVARNDRHRTYAGQSFSQLTVDKLPTDGWPAEVAETVGLIDVIWLRRGSGEIVSAFEVEKSTSIYSGILRLQDLSRSLTDCACDCYLVAPDAREREVLAQLARPSFRDNLGGMSLGYLPFTALQQHREALCTFGEDHTIVRKIDRCPCAPG